MLRFLFDTDHLTLFDHSDVIVWRQFVQRPPGSVGISAVSVEEYLRGRLAALARHQSGASQVEAYSRLVASLQLFQQFTLVAFDAVCESRYQQLRRSRLKVGSQDLRIAAIALVNRLRYETLKTSGVSFQASRFRGGSCSLVSPLRWLRQLDAHHFRHLIADEEAKSKQLEDDAPLCHQIYQEMSAVGLFATLHQSRSLVHFLEKETHKRLALTVAVNESLKSGSQIFLLDEGQIVVSHAVGAYHERHAGVTRRTSPARGCSMKL